MYRGAIHSRNAHSATRTNKHSKRNNQRKEMHARGECWPWDLNTGLHGACKMHWQLGHAEPWHDRRRRVLRDLAAVQRDTRSVAKTQYEQFWAAPPPLAEYKHIRALDCAHTRVQEHTHTRQSVTTQIQLYTTNNSKQGLNSIHTLFMLPNTTKLEHNFPTTAEHKQTLHSSAQTKQALNGSAQVLETTRALRTTKPEQQRT